MAQQLNPSYTIPHSKQTHPQPHCQLPKQSLDTAKALPTINNNWPTLSNSDHDPTQKAVV